MKDSPEEKSVVIKSEEEESAKILNAGNGNGNENKYIHGKSIPFISKIVKEENEETVKVNSKVNNEPKKSAVIGEDEIDSLLNKIDKNKTRVIIGDKAKLDFDDFEDEKCNKPGKNMDIREIFNSGGSNNNNYNYNNNKFTSTKSTLDSKINFIKNVRNNPTNTSTFTPNCKYNLNNNSNISSNKNGKLMLSNNKSNVQIIDPEKINKLPNSSTSDIILCILELCVNCKEYGFKYKSKSRAFWDEILKNPKFNKIFINFKADTLKKYWSILSEVKDTDKIVDLVNHHKELIDSGDVKLLPLITHIVDTIKGKKENFDQVLSRLIKRGRHGTTNTFLSNKRNVEEVYQQFEDVNLENKITIKEDVVRQNPEDAPLLLDDATMEMLLLEKEEMIKPNPLHRVSVMKSNINLESMLKISEFPKNRVIIPNDRDKLLYNDLDSIIRTLKVSFIREFRNEIENEQILEILKKTSFSIENTYLYLSNPEEFKYLLFSDMEDYIIRNLRNSEYFAQVVDSKGADLVEERERFLNIEI